MKYYGFTDPDNDEYEITVPDNIVKEIIKDYIQRTYYWSVALACLVIGFLVGVII